ncbi:MAG: heat shock protein transcriptional repressor HspR [Chloroflexota bacterium]
MYRKRRPNQEPPAEARPRSDSFYVISVAAKMVNVHPQTLRHYERVGLVSPSRTGGNIRLYSDGDIGRLTQIQRLIDELGVNLAGVEVIINMTDRMERMQREHEEELRRLREAYEQEVSRFRRIIGKMDKIPN